MNFKTYVGALLLAPMASLANEIPNQAFHNQNINKQFKNANISSVNNNKKISLYLTTTVNHSPNSDVMLFLLDTEQRLYAYAKDLRKIRISIDPAIENETLVLLSDIPELQYQYQEPEQSVSIQLPTSVLAKHEINLSGSEITADDLLQRKHLNAALLNYALYNTNTDGDNITSGSAETILNTPVGNIVSSFVYNSDPDQFSMNSKLIRLDTYWQHIDPIKVRSYVLGDFATNTVDWGSSVRMAGFQWASAYKQRSDLITTALPQFSGSAALPSSLDVYVDQQKIYSGNIPSGPFDVKSLPFISGNEVMLVTKDVTGQQTISKQSYYYSPQLLTSGTKEFSVDLGVPRYYFGTDSATYDNALFGSAVIKYGWMPGLTLTSNLEASSDGLVNIGTGLAMSLFNKGVLTIAASGSKYKDWRGGYGMVGLEGRLSKYLQLNASYQKTFDGYYDLARVSESRFQKEYQPLEKSSGGSIPYTALANSITRAGISFYPGSGYSMSMNYSHLKSESKHEYKPLSLSVSGSPAKNLNLYLSGFTDLADSNNYGAYISMRYALDSKISTTSAFTKNNDSNTLRQEINSQGGQRIGDLSWGGYIEHNDSNKEISGSAYGSYLSRPAYLSAQYTYLDNSQSQITASARGSVVAAAGGVFTAHEIGDAYTIVKNAGPNSSIVNGGVDLGKSDKYGRFLIPNLPAYSKRSVYVNPTHLPLDWEVETTEQQVVSGFRQGSVIDFGAQKVTSVIGIVTDTKGTAIAAGYPVKLNGRDSGVVGYNGTVYFKNPNSTNVLEIDLFEKGLCHANFSFEGAQGNMQKIGPLICR